MKSITVLLVFSVVAFSLINAREEEQAQEVGVDVNPRFKRAAAKSAKEDDGEVEQPQAQKSGKTKKAKKTSKKGKKLAISAKSAVQSRAANSVAGCSYIDLVSLSTKGSGCSTDGSKFVVKGASGIRKQFLVLNGKTIIGFVPADGKFSDCAASGFTDITASVTCKVVTGLPGVTLGPGSGVTSGGATTTKTTAAASGNNTTVASAGLFPGSSSSCTSTPPTGGTSCPSQNAQCVYYSGCSAGIGSTGCIYIFRVCGALPGSLTWEGYSLNCQPVSAGSSTCTCSFTDLTPGLAAIVPGGSIPSATGTCPSFSSTPLPSGKFGLDSIFNFPTTTSP